MYLGLFRNFCDDLEAFPSDPASDFRGKGGKVFMLISFFLSLKASAQLNKKIGNKLQELLQIFGQT